MSPLQKVELRHFSRVTEHLKIKIEFPKILAGKFLFSIFS